MFDSDRAMTGLEASIVLIAFVVVASVFSYVVIGSGLYTAQKSREVVNGAIDKVTSSIQMGGRATGGTQSDVSVQGNPLLTINLSLRLPPFSSPVDISRTTVRLITNRSVNNSIFFPEQGWTVFWAASNDNPPDMLLESGELVELCLRDLDITPSTPFIIEVLPPQGTHLSFAGTTPSQYGTVMNL